MLPSDLRQAEGQALEALRSALNSRDNGRWTVELRFEGLRLMPLALRLAAALQEQGEPLKVLFPDAGATALARRDHDQLAPLIGSLADHRRLQEQAAAPEASSSPNQEGAPAPLLLLVAPSPSDYGLVEAICEAQRGPVLLVNPTLEDAAVGIGSVARARRKGFLAQWQAAYALQPFAASALRRAHPGDWELYRLDADGFRLAGSFPRKPTNEEQAEALSGQASGGLQQQLRSLGDLIDNLQG
ncbi:MAG: DUF1995 family protein [Cyanobium sp.]